MSKEIYRYKKEDIHLPQFYVELDENEFIHLIIENSSNSIVVKLNKTEAKELARAILNEE